jgi:MFS family permease
MLGRRGTAIVLSLLAALGGIGLALMPRFSVLLAVAFVGMLNGTGTDRGAVFALEQAVLPGLVSHKNRTWALSWYNVILDSGSAVGALAAGLLLGSNWTVLQQDLVESARANERVAYLRRHGADFFVR